MTSRRKRPIKRKQGKLRDARLFLIVSEGSIPEKPYFELFDTSPRRQFHFIGPQKNRSAPVHLGKRLISVKRKLDWQADDLCAIVLDKDRWTDKALKRLAREASTHDAILALSNPCFEYWIALHFCESSDIPLDRKKLKAAVSRIKDGKGVDDFNTLLVQNVREAVRRAEELDTDRESRWAESSGSRVYRLMNRMLSGK